MIDFTKYAPVTYQDASAALPKSKFAKPPSESQRNEKILVVLDDDPTGTQTVHDIVVLTTCNVDVLSAQLRTRDPGFFILTNTRAYPPGKASQPLVLM